tara:strand:- start:277 stop:378 length:102 start_codon:yes stop_codon:yes gene_type:complete
MIGRFENNKIRTILRIDDVKVTLLKSNILDLEK